VPARREEKALGGEGVQWELKGEKKKAKHSSKGYEPKGTLWRLIPTDLCHDEGERIMGKGAFKWGESTPLGENSSMPR